MSSTAAVYESYKLDLSKKLTRIAIIKPGKWEDAVSCRLEVIDLEAGPFYETLSYCWGDAADLKPITVDEFQLDIPRTLERAIRYLRYEDQELHLWADALCINQSDAVEKGHQITHMQDIYYGAPKAHIWLGEFTEGWIEQIRSSTYSPIHAMNKLKQEEEVLKICNDCSEWRSSTQDMPSGITIAHDLSGQGSIEDGIHMLKLIRQSKHLHWLPCYASDFSKATQARILSCILAWDAVHWILSRPWWYRVWTLQEAALPKAQPVVHIGALTTHLETILEAAFVLSQHTEDLSCCRGLLGIRTSGVTSGSLLEVFRACQVFTLRRSLRKADSRRAWSLSDTHRMLYYELDCEKVEPLDVVVMASCRLATNHRDHFYGVVGVMQRLWDFQRIDTPNYKKDVGSVMTDATRYFIALTHRLQFLPSCVGLDHRFGVSLPSWTLDLSCPLKFDNWVYSNAVWDSITPNALGGDENNLLLQGSRLDVIQDVSQPITSRPYPEIKESLRHLGVRDIIGQLVSFIEKAKDLVIKSCPGLDADSFEFWNTVTSGKDTVSQGKGDDTQEVQLAAIQSWWATVKREESDEQHLSSTAQLFVSLLGQAMFCTCNGRFGMSRAGCIKGDALFYLQGCLYPVVLRKLGDEEVSGKPVYAVVGTAFIHGAMLGELRTKFPQEEIILR